MNSPVNQRIIDVATELFAQKGYGSTSVRELVEALGVTKPTLYYHFGSKEGLFLATAQAHIDTIEQVVRESLEQGDTLSDKLEALLACNIQFALERPDVLRFLTTCLHQVDHGQPEIDLKTVDTTTYFHLTSAFEAAIERGELSSEFDAVVAAISFLGILRGWTFAAFHGAPIHPDTARTAVHHFLHGIYPR